MSDVILALDIGGTKIAAVGYSAALAPLGELANVPTQQVANASLLQQFVSDCATKLTAGQRRLIGVGVCVAGSVDSHEARVVMSPNARWLDGTNLRDLLEPVLGVPVAAANDADAFTLAEWHSGGAAGLRHVIGVTLGTGVGGGLVLEGRLHRGTGIGANEVGHVAIDLNGPPCTCGSNGCLEAYCGGWAVARSAANVLRGYVGPTRFSSLRDALAAGGGAASPEELTGEALDQAAREGDPFARHFWDAFGEWMGVAMASLVNVVRPEAIVFGGSGARSLSLFEGRMADTVARRVLPPLYAGIRYLPAAAPQPGTLGAALVLREQVDA